MTTELVTGKSGKPHIDGDDIGSLTAGIVGHGNYLLESRDGTYPRARLQDANHVLMPAMNLIVEGRYARVTAAETVTIDSGQSGQKRNDLICMKYSRNAQQVETIALTVLKGTPTTGTPADPTIPAGSILDGAATAYAPIARVTIDGLTPATPVMLTTDLPPIDSTSVIDGWQVVRRLHGYDAYRNISMTFPPTANSAFTFNLPIPVANWQDYTVTAQLMNNGGGDIPFFNEIQLIPTMMGTTRFQVNGWNASKQRLSYRVGVCIHARLA